MAGTAFRPNAACSVTSEASDRAASENREGAGEDVGGVVLGVEDLDPEREVPGHPRVRVHEDRHRDGAAGGRGVQVGVRELARGQDGDFALYSEALLLYTHTGMARSDREGTARARMGDRPGDRAACKRQAGFVRILRVILFRRTGAMLIGVALGAVCMRRLHSW